MPESDVLGQEEKRRGNVCALEDSAVPLECLEPAGIPTWTSLSGALAPPCVTDVLHGAAGMLQMLWEKDGDCEEPALRLFLIVFGLVSAENETSAITGNPVISHLSPRTSQNRVTSAPFGSRSGFDPQSVGTALGLQFHWFFRSSFLLLAPKRRFSLRTRLGKGSDLSLWTGRERAPCAEGLPGCKLRTLQPNEL